MAYQDGAIVSRTIADKPGGTITLFAFDAGQGLSEHAAPFDQLQGRSWVLGSRALAIDRAEQRCHRHEVRKCQHRSQLCTRTECQQRVGGPAQQMGHLHILRIANRAGDHAQVDRAVGKALDVVALAVHEQRKEHEFESPFDLEQPLAEIEKGGVASATAGSPIHGESRLGHHGPDHAPSNAPGQPSGCSASKTSVRRASGPSRRSVSVI